MTIKTKLSILIGLLGMLPLLTPARSHGADETDVQIISRLANDYFSDPLAEFEIAGIAVAVTSNDTLAWSTGYGYADIEAGVPMDPAKSIVHIASVTKLITAIAILQLTESGKLSLDDDINTYLTSFQIPKSKGQKITIRGLLTHSSGLGEDYLGIAARSPGDVGTLEEFLSTHLPPQVHPSGVAALYSNFGYALLGAAIENASGERYSDYIEEHIFDELGMTKSASNTSAKAAKFNIAPGYFYRENILEEPKFYERLGPAGNVLSTVEDIARLMRALLNPSVPNPVLSPQSASTLFSTQWRPKEGLPGYAFGPWEVPNFAEPVYVIGGEAPGYATRVLVLPKRNLSIIVTANRKDPLPANEFFNQVLAQLVQAKSEPAPQRSEAMVADVSGIYRLSRYPRTNFLKIGALFAPEIHVEQRGETALFSYKSFNQADEERFQGVDGLFYFDNSTSPIGFDFDDSNTVTRLHFYYPLVSPIAFEPVGRLRASETQLIILLVLFTGFAFHIISAGLSVGAMAFIFRRHRQAHHELARLRIFSFLTSCIIVLFLCVFFYGVWRYAIAVDDRFAFGAPLWFQLSFYLVWIAIFFSLVQIYQGVVVWRNNSANMYDRTKHGLLSLACIAFFLWANEWQLIGGALQF